MKYKKIMALLLVCALSVTALCGCGKKQTEAAERPFTIAVAETPDSLNPIVSAGGLTEEFFLLCYDPLWRLDETGTPTECLVDSSSLSSDGLTWTIRIRQDVTFSDGQPLTAKDVLFSYEMAMQYSSLYADYFDGISDMRCPDDYTIIITTDTYKSDMKYNPTPILPEHIWGDYEFSPEDFDNAEMIGSGPFLFSQLSEEDEQSGWAFTAREDYFGGSPQTSEFRFLSYGNVASAAKDVASGDVDASFGLTDVQLTTLQEVPGVQLIESVLPGAEIWGLAYNTQSDFFADQSMRELIDCCLDREWMISMAAGGAGETGSSFVSSGADYYSAVSGDREYGTALVRSRLTAAGYTDSDEDGILEDSKGEPLTLTLYSSDEDAWAPSVASILEASLMEAGISIEWVKSDGDIRSACEAGGDWDMCLYSWNGSTDAFLACTQFVNDMQTMTGWEDASVQAALALVQTASDEEAVRSAAAQLQQLVYTGCAVSVIAYKADIQAVRSDGWGGYQTALDFYGGIFGIGSAAAYMSLTSEAVG